MKKKRKNTDFNITFLGTGTTLLNSDRSCSSSLLQCGPQKILVDIGGGTCRRLAEMKLNILEINRIVTTHFHPDHVGDLVNFLFAYYNVAPQERQFDLEIYGPSGIDHFLKAMSDGYGSWLESCLGKIQVKTIRPGITEAGDVQIYALPVRHTENSLAYRFDYAGKKMVFSGDTAPCENIVKLCKGATAALLECARLDGSGSQSHLSAADIIDIAKRSAVKRIFLNHLYPEVFETHPEKKIFEATGTPTELVDDGDVVSL